ncbi:MAG: hypothetical protein V3S64_07910 [bacterium]
MNTPFSGWSMGFLYGSFLRRFSPRGKTLPAAVVLFGLALMLASACGNPKQGDPVGTVLQSSDPVPSGPHLYCIVNVGQTLTTFSLNDRQVLPGTARILDLDPVGPWFDSASGDGFYLARVDGSGAGANALIKFDPKTTVEQARLKFPANSNPNHMLILPTHPGMAWVALKGATFDNFATNGLSVVNLSTMADEAFCDLNAATATCDPLAPAQGGDLTSLLGFYWDAGGCGGPPGCAYAVVGNFDGAVREGWLLVLTPDMDGKPVFQDAIRLGRNPRLEMVLEKVVDAARELWVVNNGGYVHFGDDGAAGTLQVLETSLFAIGTAGDGTVDTISVVGEPAICDSPPSPDPGCDPTGIYSLDGGSAWVTTYPDDVLRTLDLSGYAMDTLDTGLPRVTGPFFSVGNPPSSLFAGLNGFGQARLGEIDSATGAKLAEYDLRAGQGPVSCAEFDTP